MKTRSEKRNVDPKLHVRKRTAGIATGAILGATVAGPVGALIGGAIGTFIGDAAEKGARPPKPNFSRAAKATLRSIPRSKVSSKAAPRRSAKNKTAAPPRTRTKK